MPTETVTVELLKETDTQYLLINLKGDQSWFLKRYVKFVGPNRAEIPLEILEGRMWDF